MARLIKVTGEDFAGFRNFELDLANQGLVFIGGENRDTGSATSNGACKSGIFKAIGWCLYGKSVDNEYGDKVIHRGTKRARVIVLVEDSGDTYAVIRERHKQSPKLFMEKNGAKLKMSKSDIQDQIDKMIGVDWDGFKNTVLYGQMDRDRFIYPTTKDGDRKSVLQKILRTGIFSLCFSEAKRRRLEVEKELSSFEGQISSLTERISDQDLSVLEKRVSDYEEERSEKCKSLIRESRKIFDKIKKASKSKDHKSLLQQSRKLGKAIEGLKDKIYSEKKRAIAARKEYEESSTLLVRLSEQLEGVNKNISLLSGRVCPLCTGSLKSGDALGQISDLKASREALSNDMSSAKERKGAARKAEERADKAIDAATSSVNELSIKKSSILAKANSIQSEKDHIDELEKIAKSKADEAKKLKTQKNPYVEALESAKKKIKKLKKERRSIKENASKSRKQLSCLEFWVKGFGPTGIQSFALDSVMPFITKRANYYLKQLSDGDISINFSTQRELKSSSGEFRDEIGITWMIEGIENYPPSGGQWKKMEIATNFAMMDLVTTREGSHVNMLCLDECLDGLDPEGRQRVVLMLHRLRKRKESIFVISHHADMAEIFERSVNVIKEEGVSWLEKAA